MYLFPRERFHMSNWLLELLISSVAQTNTYFVQCTMASLTCMYLNMKIPDCNPLYGKLY